MTKSHIVEVQLIDHGPDSEVRYTIEYMVFNPDPKTIFEFETRFGFRTRLDFAVDAAILASFPPGSSLHHPLPIKAIGFDRLPTL